MRHMPGSIAITGPYAEFTWGHVHWPAFPGISAVSMFFAHCGARISQVMDKRKLKLAFAAFLAMLVLHMQAF